MRILGRGFGFHRKLPTFCSRHSSRSLNIVQMSPPSILFRKYIILNIYVSLIPWIFVRSSLLTFISFSPATIIGNIVCSELVESVEQRRKCLAVFSLRCTILSSKFFRIIKLCGPIERFIFLLKIMIDYIDLLVDWSLILLTVNG